MRRYLHDDSSLSCDSLEYDATWRVALALIAVWPLGVPFLYTVLLWRSPPRSSVALLHADYTPAAHLWEVAEVVRKITLCSAMVLLPEEAEQGRVLVALLISTVWLALQVLQRSCCCARAADALAS